MTKRTVLHQGNILDVNSGKLLENHSVVLENGRINWVGESGTFEKLENDDIINLEGKLVIPGLIDCHVHLEASCEIDYWKDRMRRKDPMYHYIALKNGQEHLKSGFTTVRDCGGDLWGASLRRIFESKMFPGPRLLVAQIPMSQWGNQESMGPSEFFEVEKKYEILSGKDGITHAVRERKRSGSDFIKTMTTGGVLHGMESQLERSLWTDEEISALVKEAHRLGMHVAVHAHGNHGIHKAATAGVDTIEHCSFVDEEAARIMIKNNVHLVPTQTSAFIDKPEIMKQLQPEVAKKTIEVDEAMFKNHKIAFELGVKIALGTDAGVPGNPHGTSARELTSMVKYIDITPLQAIQIGTIEAARAINLEHKIGSIEIGKSADLLVVTGDVLNDVTILENRENLDYVIKDGDILVQKGKLIK